MHAAEQDFRLIKTQREKESKTHYVRWGNSAVIEVEVHVIDAV